MTGMGNPNRKKFETSSLISVSVALNPSAKKCKDI